MAGRADSMSLTHLGGDYSLHQLLESNQIRVRARDFGHIRAVEDSKRGLGAGGPHGSLIGRIMAHAPRRAIGSAEPAIAISGHELTAAVCRLADGTAGRIAVIRLADEAWETVCVAP